MGEQTRPLKIAVCIKQVATGICHGNSSQSFERKASEQALNPYDLPAIGLALALKSAYQEQNIAINTEVLTMGPPSAKTVLELALAYGIDCGWLIEDEAFAGADVQITAYTLAQAMISVGSFDLIICGKQSIDSDTGQVAPALAQQLALNYATNVMHYCAITDKKIEIAYKQDGDLIRRWLVYPALLAVSADIFPAPALTLKGKLAAKHKVITRLSLNVLPDSDSEHYGIFASPTQVERLTIPSMQKRQVQLLTGEPNEVIEQLIPFLSSFLAREDKK